MKVIEPINNSGLRPSPYPSVIEWVMWKKKLEMPVHIG
jgi:hypothetical protein